MPNDKKNIPSLTAEDLMAVLNALPLRIFWKDTNGKFLGANTAFLHDAHQHSLTDIIGKSDFDLDWTKEQAQGFRDDDAKVISSGLSKVDIEEQLTLKNGSTLWLNTNKVPLIKNGSAIGVLGTYNDITDKKIAYQEIAHMAGHDELTGLPNRRYLMEVLKQYMDRHHRTGYAGLLFIDLDHFKTVNDSLGHRVGDKLLQQVAKRIIDNSQHSLVARLGGDEFCVLYAEHNNQSDISHFEKSITKLSQDILEVLLTPFTEEDHTLFVGASIGIAIITPLDREPSEKLKEADLALYAAKDSGRNIEVIFDDGMRKAVKRRHAIENSLRSAIKNNEMRLFYQPQFNNNGAILGAEALLRWNTPAFGQVSPLEFIPVAELSFLINNIGLWVLEEAIKKIAQHSKLFETKGIKTIAVNVSTKQFQRPGFSKQVIQLLEKYKVNPKHLQIEVTESLLMEHQERIQQELQSLKALDISLAMDDFGTGYSSLSYLTRLPIDKLKIDRAFIQDMDQNSQNRSIVESIIVMTKKLGLISIAEGVETNAELMCLKDIGCDSYQGYFFSHPISEAKFDALLENYQPPSNTPAVAPTITLQSILSSQQAYKPH